MLIVKTYVPANDLQHRTQNHIEYTLPKQEELTANTLYQFFHASHRKGMRFLFPDKMLNEDTRTPSDKFFSGTILNTHTAGHLRSRSTAQARENLSVPDDQHRHKRLINLKPKTRMFLSTAVFFAS